MITLGAEKQQMKIMCIYAAVGGSSNHCGDGVGGCGAIFFVCLNL
jgi:hypothetical protein